MFSSAHTPARKPGSRIAMAIALACGTALTTVALEAPAFAQKKPKTNYSEAFIAAYNPANEMLKAGAPDKAAMAAAAAQVEQAISTDDDKMGGGGFLYNVGVALDDTRLKRRGFDLMIESGKVAPEKIAEYHFNAGNLAYNDEDFAAARASFNKAIELNYAGQDVRPVIAETYFREDNFEAGTKYLRDLIGGYSARGEVPPEDWIKRGMSIAYNNDLGQEAIRYSLLWAEHYPSSTSWHDATAIQLQFVDFDNNATLDLLRLARRTGGLINRQVIHNYIEVADPRKLPNEVRQVIEQGLADGFVTSDDLFVSDSLSTAKTRAASDRGDLASLEADGKSAGSSAINTTSSGDVFLNVGNAATAEELYTLALTKPGVDTQRVLTRLGIAQVDQGKFAEATETFEKVEGIRLPIALAWLTYIRQQQSGAEVTADATM